MIKAFAFDLDGTLTQHQAPLGDANRAILEQLAAKYTLLVVGEGDVMQIHRQIGDFSIDIIGNYGIQYAKNEGGAIRVIRESSVPCQDKARVDAIVTAVQKRYGFTVLQGDDAKHRASGYLTFSLLDAEVKADNSLPFDSPEKKRRAFYGEVCAALSDYNVFIDASSLDVVPKPFNKYYALDLFCRENGFSHDEVIFIGDGYGVGGTDESIYHSDFRFITVDDYAHLSEVLAPFIQEDLPDIDVLLCDKADCACGVTHTCDIERVLIRHGALNELPAMTKKFGHILLVADENTYAVCGARAAELLADKIEDSLIYTSEGFLVPDESAVAQMEVLITEKTDLILGIGSGVINDLCKHVSHAHGLPYYIVATAPSMDGYASKGAAMLFGGMKITTSAATPRAIIADTAVLTEAPLEMIKSGYGDIIGKYSCLNDWRLSHLINGESVCEYIYDLTYTTVCSVASMGKRIAAREEASIAALMRALVIVGIAMAYMGNSRPASGSEHHLSHYFEVVGLLRNEPYFCHGTDVAYSTYETAKIRSALIALDAPREISFDEVAWENEILRVYGTEAGTDTAKGILALQRKLGRIYDNKYPVLCDKWSEIKAVLADSPSPEEVLGMLDTVGLPISDFERMYSEAKVADALRYAKDLKDRYTVLWLYDQIAK